ncbi:MAG: hypothetical protein K0R26_2504 [Bacteroidota bacterium]|nr:hypothetical protein [Bacteroidota bacterium]
MVKFRVIYGIIFFLGMFNFLQCQIAVGSVSNISKINQGISDTLKPTQIETKISSGELIPSPEEQGYLKYNVNGDIFYRREIGSLIIEYKPKN